MRVYEIKNTLSSIYITDIKEDLERGSNKFIKMLSKGGC